MTMILPPRFRGKSHRVMLFVDGENLTIRFGAELGTNTVPEHVTYEKDVFVWSSVFEEAFQFYNVVKKFYYTTAAGDHDHLLDMEDSLRALGIESPRVFRKRRGKKSKQVDIALVTDMLKHAYRDNFDIAILVSGDEDFVPAMQAVSDEGKNVVLWHMESGLSKPLLRASDYAFDLSRVLLANKPKAWEFIFHG